MSSNVEIHRVKTHIDWFQIGTTAVALVIGILLGRGCDHRDWSLSTQWTKVTQVEDVTTGQRTVIQEQSGSTESRTQPGPNNPGADLFGKPDGQ